MKAAEVGFKYVPEPQIPGVYWDYVYSGPLPTKFGENPRFAEMVRQGKLPPVEKRLPEDFKVSQPPDGIGQYGGIWRITSTAGGPSNRMYWDKKNADEVTHIGHVGFYELSDDGRVYTFRLRKGLKFSDGEDFTMEDIKFAWEDVNLNDKLHQTYAGQWLDVVTGATVKFAVVDDLHWTLTWDTPDFTLMEGEVRPGMRCTASTFCFYAPKHHLKKWHEDYADPADIAKMIAEEEVQDWPQLWFQVNNISTHVDLPVPAPFFLSSESDNFKTWDANPYFFVVDPEGNQLPYVDGFQFSRVESREVSVFRGMAGETDLGARGFLIAEIPLYRSHSQKGDFNLKIWPSTGPGDLTTSLCQTCNQDAEVGKWLRTRDFRIALSHAIDREAVNDTIFLGLGTPKNWVAHPSTAYYPGDEWAFKDTEYDPDKANNILDSLGLTERDSEGFRLRTDGSGERLSFRTMSQLVGPVQDSEALFVDYWADVGIEVNRNFGTRVGSVTYIGKEYWSTLLAHYSYYGANPWFSGWSRCCGTIARGPAWAPDISGSPGSMKKGPEGAAEGAYTPRSGDEQMPIWMPKAPAANYPADPSGNIGILQDNWRQGKLHPQFSPERIALGKEIHRIHGLEKYMLSYVAHTGTQRGIVLNRNNFLNAPQTHIADTVGFYGELYYFVDGNDNIGD